jgi:ABC-type uncharacterized transport system permease subunit
MKVSMIDLKVFHHSAVQSVTKALIAIACALLIGALVLFLIGNDPYTAYLALFQGAFGSKRCFGENLLSTTPLLFGGLAFLFAYRCGLFNLGIEGQITMGGMAAAFLGYSVKGLPPVVHIASVLIGSAVMGAIWAAGPGYLKARFGIHEVISTIMMNHIAFKIAGFMVAVGGPMKDPTDEMPASQYILGTAKLNRIWQGTRLHWGIFLALFVAFLIWFILFRTRLGYRIKAVGKNRYAAETAGISVKANFIIAIAVSGALGGLAGGVEVAGIHYRLLESFSPGYGFDAIAVGLLGMLHPFGVIASAFLFGILRSGAIYMQAVAGVSKDLVGVTSAIIIFFMGMSDSQNKWIAIINKKVGKP